MLFKLKSKEDWLDKKTNSEGLFIVLQKRKAFQGGEKNHSGKRNNKEKNGGQGSKNGGKRRNPPCPHCKRNDHSKKYCWFRPNVQCRSCKQFGHLKRVCKNKNDQQKQQAQIAENQQQHQKEELFVATCYATSHSTNAWFIDSGYTNHMTPDSSNLWELD